MQGSAFYACTLQVFSDGITHFLTDRKRTPRLVFKPQLKIQHVFVLFPKKGCTVHTAEQGCVVCLYFFFWCCFTLEPSHPAHNPRPCLRLFRHLLLISSPHHLSRDKFVSRHRRMFLTTKVDDDGLIS